MGVRMAFVEANRPEKPWTSVPEVPPLPPRPPTRLVPAESDFTFIDHGTDRQYWISLYRDDQVSHNRVFVQDPGEIRRPATPAEASFAYLYFERAWGGRSVQGRLLYLQQRGKEPWPMPPRLMDELIDLKEQEVLELSENALELESQIRAMGAVGEEGDHRTFVAVRLDSTYRELGRAQSELDSLKRRKFLIYSLQ